MILYVFKFYLVAYYLNRAQIYLACACATALHFVHVCQSDMVRLLLFPSHVIIAHRPIHSSITSIYLSIYLDIYHGGETPD
jgi:hypothetical protein